MIELAAVALCCVATLVAAFGTIWLSVEYRWLKLDHGRLEWRLAKLERDVRCLSLQAVREGWPIAERLRRIPPDAAEREERFGRDRAG
jgi:hypothetical protein